MTTTQENLIAKRISKKVKALLKKSEVPEGSKIDVVTMPLGTHFEMTFVLSEKSSEDLRGKQCHIFRNGFIHNVVEPAISGEFKLLGWKQFRIKAARTNKGCPMRYLWLIENRTR